MTSREGYFEARLVPTPPLEQQLAGQEMVGLAMESPGDLQGILDGPRYRDPQTVTRYLAASILNLRIFGPEGFADNDPDERHTMNPSFINRYIKDIARESLITDGGWEDMLERVSRGQAPWYETWLTVLSAGNVKRGDPLKNIAKPPSSDDYWSRAILTAPQLRRTVEEREALNWYCQYRGIAAPTINSPKLLIRAMRGVIRDTNVSPYLDVARPNALFLALGRDYLAYKSLGHYKTGVTVKQPEQADNLLETRIRTYMESIDAYHKRGILGANKRPGAAWNQNSAEERKHYYEWRCDLAVQSNSKFLEIFRQSPQEIVQSLNTVYSELSTETDISSETRMRRQERLCNMVGALMLQQSEDSLKVLNTHKAVLSTFVEAHILDGLALGVNASLAQKIIELNFAYGNKEQSHTAPFSDYFGSISQDVYAVRESVMETYGQKPYNQTTEYNRLMLAHDIFQDVSRIATNPDDKAWNQAWNQLVKAIEALKTRDNRHGLMIAKLPEELKTIVHNVLG